MEKVVMQRIEEFYALGTSGAEGGKKTLESVICRVNNEGWRVDQIVPCSFRPDGYSKGGLDMTSGILLCSCVAK